MVRRRTQGSHSDKSTPSLIVAHKPEELRAVRELLCEAWCDIDRLRFDQKNDTLELELEEACAEPKLDRWGWLWSTWSCRAKVWLLKVRRVIRWSLDDEAHIGRVELATMEYDARTQEIKIRSEFPVVITVQVRDLDVEIEQTEVRVQRKQIMLFNWVQIGNYENREGETGDEHRHENREGETGDENWEGRPGGTVTE